MKIVTVITKADGGKNCDGQELHKKRETIPVKSDTCSDKNDIAGVDKRREKKQDK